MRYLIERNLRKEIVELPAGAQVKFEPCVVSSDDNEGSLLNVFIHLSDRLYAGFAMVTAFYPEEMEPKKEDFI